MKRGPFLFAGFLGVLLVLGTACGGGAAPTPTKAPAAKATPTPVAKPAATPIPGPPFTGTPLEIGSVGEEFKFAITTLTSKTGTDVLVRYKNNSKAVEHNWVLVKAGTEGDVANKGTTAAATGWIPQGHPGIVANTKLLKAGETGDARFTAPAVGKYKFICTFPGHFEGGMVGEFEVTP